MCICMYVCMYVRACVFWSDQINNEISNFNLAAKDAWK